MIENLTHLPSLVTFINHINNKDLKETIEEEITIINHKLKFIVQEGRKSVLIINHTLAYDSSISPTIKDCITLCGGQPVDSITDNPEILLILADNPSAYGTLPEMLLDFPFAELSAVKNNQVYVVNNLNLENEQEENLLASIEVLAEIIQPKYFIFGKNGTDWVQFDLN